MSNSPVNPPDMPALAYRARTYATSLANMLAFLPVFAIPSGPNAGTTPLAALRTRQPGDPTLALLDAWAMVMDVLCFYQERIADEGFLGTAVERLSVLELARGIGCELDPGLAANAYLAFTVENAPGAPRRADVPVGTQVQSVPGQGQQPQTFETVEDISARAAWNQLNPLLTQPQILATSNPSSGSVASTGQIQLAGTNTGLVAGSVLYVPGQNAVVQVSGVQTDPVGGTTTVTLAQSQSVALSAEPSLPQGPPTGSAAPPAGPLPLTPANVSTYVLGYTWNGSDLDTFLLDKGWDPGAVQRLTRDNQAQQAAPQAGNVAYAFAQQLGVLGRSAAAASYYQVTAAYAVANSSPTTYTETAVTGLAWTPGAGSVALSWTASSPTPTQYNVYRSYGPGAAPGSRGGALVGSVTPPTTSFADAFPGWNDVNGLNVRDIWTSSGGTSYASGSPAADVVLERSVPGLLPGSYLVVRDPSLPAAAAYTLAAAVDASVTGYGATLTTTELTLSSPSKTVLPLARNSTAWVQSRPLQLTSTVASSTATLPLGSLTVTLDHLVLGLSPGQLVMLAGQRADAPTIAATEVLTLGGVVHAGGYTQLTFTTPPQYSYPLSTLTISANVAPATHGQTSAGEIIGSGDGTQANQTFTLSRTGLTFVATPSGPATTLSVQVNGVAWQQQPTLYGQAPHATAYMVRLDDAGDVNVTFGDGVYGARLPTGQENVTATYRTGTGVAGDVGAGALKLLMTRPFGVSSVQNPLPAAGGVDPETLEQAQANAPGRMRTLGRIVTLSDYQDFAGTFSGIAKAQSTTLSNGVTTFIHVTVAGTGGAVLASTSAVWQGLVGAISAAGDPRLTVLLDNYTPCFFGLAATLLAAAGQDPATVTSAALGALAAAFAFDLRSFAQPVAAAEVIALLQGVPGVLGVTLTELFRTDASSPPAPPPPQLVCSAAGGWNPSTPGQTLGAELLLLSTTRTTLTVQVLS